MENPRDWEKLKEIGEVYDIGAGEDSTVSHLRTPKSEMIVKEYFSLTEKVGVPVGKEILQQYYADTEKAEVLLRKNPNPLGQKIKIKNVIYEINYSIVPQGGVLLEGHDLYKDETRANALSAGQKFVKGKNFSDLANGEYEDDWKRNGQHLLYEDLPFTYEIEDILANLNKYLNNTLNVKFSESTVNAKPFLDEKSKKLNIVITDLCASLSDYFISSPSMTDLRAIHPEVVKLLKSFYKK